CPVCPRLAPGGGVCFETGDLEDEDSTSKQTVSSQMFEDLKVLLLELTILLFKQCGVIFSHAVTFGLKAARTLNSVSDPKLKTTELIHYAAFNYHPRLSKLLLDDNERATDYEQQLVTSITLLYAKAVVPSLHELSEKELEAILKSHFKEALIRTSLDKAKLTLNNIKSYLSFKDTDNPLSQPIRTRAQHDVLNNTEVAISLLKPATHVLPTISTETLKKASSVSVKKGYNFNITISLCDGVEKDQDDMEIFKDDDMKALSDLEIEDVGDDNMDIVNVDQVVDMDRVLRTGGYLEILARLIVRGLQAGNKALNGFCMNFKAADTLFIKCARVFKAFGQSYKVEMVSKQELQRLNVDRLKGNGFLSVGMDEVGVSSANVQHYPLVKKDPPGDGRTGFKQRTKQRVEHRPAKTEGNVELRARSKEREQQKLASSPNYIPFSPLEEDTIGAKAMDAVYEIAKNYADALALGDNSSNSAKDKAKVKIATLKIAQAKTVVTHTVVSTTCGQRRSHGIPVARPRQPTVEETTAFDVINVGNGKKRSKAELVSKLEHIKSVITVMCSVEACLRRMIVAYYLTVLVAADYYLEKLAKVSYLPPCLAAANITGGRKQLSHEDNLDIVELIKSISDVTFTHIKDLYVDLVSELINLPEKKNDSASEKIWESFRAYLEWMRMITSEDKEYRQLGPSTSPNFCIKRKNALGFIHEICVNVYRLCQVGREKLEAISKKLDTCFSLPAAWDGGAANARRLCVGILKRGKDSGTPESSDESGSLKKMVTLSCKGKKNYDHPEVPGANNDELYSRFSDDQQKIWISLIEGKFTLRFLWSKENKRISFSKLFTDIKTTLFPSAEQPEDPAENLKSHSTMLRGYWGYMLEVVAPKNQKQNDSQGESAKPLRQSARIAAMSENLSDKGKGPMRSENIKEADNGNDSEVDGGDEQDEAASEDEEEEEEEEKQKGKVPGIKQATWALLASIQTIFVLEDRPFMDGFKKLFDKHAGCSLGANLLGPVLKSVKGEIDGWEKVSKYTWISLFQHPMVRRLFPNGEEETALIRINPEGEYQIEPIPLQVEARSIKFDQLINGVSVQLSKKDKIQTGKNEKAALLTGAEFNLRLGSTSVKFSLGLSAKVTVPKNEQFKRTWGTATLVVNSSEEIVLSIPFKLEGVGQSRIPKDIKSMKHRKALKRPTGQVILEEEEVFFEKDYPFIFYRYRKAKQKKKSRKESSGKKKAGKKGNQKEEDEPEVPEPAEPVQCRRNVMDVLVRFVEIHSLKQSEQHPEGQTSNADHLLQKLTELLPDDADAKTVLKGFEANVEQIRNDVLQAIAVLDKRKSSHARKLLANRQKILKALPETDQTKQWDDDMKRGYCCFGDDVEVTLGGRGSLRHGAVALDLGARKPVTAVTEKGDMLDCGKNLVAFLRYGLDELAAKQQFISHRANEDSRVKALYLELETERASLPQQQQGSDEWKEAWRKRMKRENDIQKKIAETKKEVEDRDELSKKIRRDEAILRKKMKARIAKFQDEVSNLFAVFKLVIIPPLETEKLVTNDKQIQIDGKSKSILTWFSHKRLVELIKEKVSKEGGRVLITTEAFTTKTCSYCGCHQYVGPAKLFRCRSKECGKVMDRDGNAAINILRDTLLRVLEGHRRRNGGLPDNVTQAISGTKTSSQPSTSSSSTVDRPWAKEPGV
ncbi:hypothetical protein HDU96_005168, partial [Phlyctochytrium bullatum]